MNDVQPVRRPAPGAFIKRQRYREWGFYAAFLLLLVAILGLLGYTSQLNDEIERREEGMYRSQAEMINGGKRFIDAFYSVNSATVMHDQFKAISMMATDALKKKRLTYLKHQDLVRKVQDAGLSSTIRWGGAKVEVVDERPDDQVVVEYRARMIINERDAYPLNIVLTLVPAEKTDDNTDGVGVLSWTDVGETPFVEGVAE